ncbi:transposase [Sphingomonas sp. ID1715]|nr:transposase [Sphingomonas sp. ID1715]
MTTLIAFARIEEQGATPNIPAKSNRTWRPCFSTRLYRDRKLIGRFFNKLNHFRRIATRYDKLAGNISPWSSSPHCGCGCGYMSLPPS